MSLVISLIGALVIGTAFAVTAKVRGDATIEEVQTLKKVQASDHDSLTHVEDDLHYIKDAVDELRGHRGGK